MEPAPSRSGNAAQSNASATSSLAALGCGAVAVVIAVLDATSPAFAALPVAPSLIVVGIGAMSMGLRELSVRGQFAQQSDHHMRALRELEKRIQWLKITEAHALVGHWRLDLATEQVFWSDGTYTLHGIEPGTPPSLDTALDFYHEDDRHIVIETIEEARRTGEPYTFRARLIRKDGTLRYVDAGARVEMSADGRPLALFGVIKDRTSEEMMQQQLRSARDDAKALARSKGEFLARMSHEIRTPMNGVLGFAELLGASELSPDQKRQADLIVESGKSLQTLLNDILDLSKIEAGSIEVKPTSIDLEQLINRSTQLIEPAARAKAIVLECKPAPDLPRYIQADPVRLRQILTNLLSNAVRFTDQGSVTLSVMVIDQTVHFSVSDTGIGIAEGMQSVIFDPFAQGFPDKRLNRGGTGLGLSISRQLAQVLGGKLSLVSEIGQGSIFTLSLPFIKADAVPTSTPAPTQSPAPPPSLQPDAEAAPKVLLAEDYDINRELITEMARRIGVEVECAGDGSEAVSMVHAARKAGEPYQMVLMDLQMPRLDGIEATQRLRSAGIGEDELPIVALTANAFAEDVENCLASGMQAHLAKPVSLDRLSAAITKWAKHGTEPRSSTRSTCVSPLSH